MKNISLAALLMVGAAFTACSSDDNIIEEQPVVNPTKNTVTMTVMATKGDITRGLSLDGQTLNTVWKTTDVIKVYKQMPSGSTPVGTLNPTSNTSGIATLTGTVSDVDENDKLLLFIGVGGIEYDFTGQKGVLYRDDDPENSIESKYDYASSGLTGAPFYAHFLKDGENDILTLSSSNINEKYSTTYDKATATFTNDVAAIVKFTLLDKDNKPVNASQFNISCTSNASYISLKRSQTGGGTLSVVPNTPSNVLYVAISCQSSTTSKNYNFTAYSDDTYTLNKELSGYLFQPGKYYEVTLKMKAAGGWTTFDLSTYNTGGTNIYQVPANGKYKLTGTLKSDYGIKVGAGATVMLDGVTVSPTTGTSGVAAAGIHCEGDATIILNNGTTNTVSGGENGSDHFPGIYVAEGSTLTIRGGGTLTATGQNSSAGIGNGNAYQYGCHDAGNILIESGTITANGGVGAPGIGGTGDHSCGSITIKGGTITANGGAYGAGIGGKCGDINITSGTITANAGQSINGEYTSHASAAIGSNHNKSCGNITITGGTITAVGRDALQDKDGANVTVIGASGASGTCASVTIGAGVNSVEMTTNRLTRYATTNHDNWSASEVTGKAFLRATNVTVAGTDITSLLNSTLESTTDLEDAVKGTTFKSSVVNWNDDRGWYFDLTK